MPPHDGSRRFFVDTSRSPGLDISAREGFGIQCSSSHPRALLRTFKRWFNHNAIHRVWDQGIPGGMRNKASLSPGASFFSTAGFHTRVRGFRSLSTELSTGPFAWRERRPYGERADVGGPWFPGRDAPIHRRQIRITRRPDRGAHARLEAFPSRKEVHVSIADISDERIGGPRENERTPPHDLLAEQSTLGGMLLSKDEIGRAHV